MSSRCLKPGIILSILCAAFSASAQQRVLRVCADPDNLPFSNDARQGFENRLAEIAARDLHATLEYTWWPQKRGFVRQTLDAGRCDVLPGVPATLDSLLTTHPYYRSGYVFVSRRERALGVTSLTDPRLRDWRIGIHLVGDNYAPPAVALGSGAHLVGFRLTGPYGVRNPQARLIDAVARGDVDLAIAWGPLAGYFAQLETAPLDIVPVSPASFQAVPFRYDISMGVRKGNKELRAELDKVLRQECPAIARLLAGYGVPRMEEGGPGCDAWQPLRSARSR